MKPSVHISKSAAWSLAYAAVSSGLTINPVSKDPRFSWIPIACHCQTRAYAPEGLGITRFDENSSAKSTYAPLCEQNLKRRGEEEKWEEGKVEGNWRCLRYRKYGHEIDSERGLEISSNSLFSGGRVAWKEVRWKRSRSQRSNKKWDKYGQQGRLLLQFAQGDSCDTLSWALSAPLQMVITSVSSGCFRVWFVLYFTHVSSSWANISNFFPPGNFIFSLLSC